MKKVFHLSTCNTCQRIIKETGLDKRSDIELQDIKSKKISSEDLEHMHALAGSYEALFTRRSRQYRIRGLHEKELSETDMRDLILDEYTFLKRPVTVLEGQVFIGNAKKDVEALKAALS